MWFIWKFLKNHETNSKGSLNSYLPDMSEWPKVQQPPGSETADWGIWRLNLGPLTHITSIICLLYPYVMSCFDQLFKKYISNFSHVRFNMKSYYCSHYLQLSCRNWSVKSVLSRHFFVCLLCVNECHVITACDVMTTTSRSRVTVCDIMTTMSKIRATKSGH